MPTLTKGQSADGSVTVDSTLVIQARDGFVRVEKPIGTTVYEGKAAPLDVKVGSFRVTCTEGTAYYEVTQDPGSLAPVFTPPPWGGKFGFVFDNWQLLNDIDRKLITRHGTHFVPELIWKPERLFKAEGVYDWSETDTFLTKVSALGGTVRLHVMYWANMPSWFFAGTLAQTQARITTAWTAFRDHCVTLLGSTEFNRIFYSVEPVNEVCKRDLALSQPFKDNTTGPSYQSWSNPLYGKYEANSAGTGKQFASFMFNLAHSLFPQAKLVWNDGFSDWLTEAAQNVDAAIALTRPNLTGGTTIDAMGAQFHMGAWQTVAQLVGATNNLLAISLANGTSLCFSEPDWTIYEGAGTADYGDAPPDTVMQSQYDRARALGAALRAWNVLHPGHITEFTVWGVTDAYSYCNDIPSRRTDRPTLFDKNGLAKPTYYALFGV